MDQKLAVKHALLKQLLGEARGKMAGNLKSKYAPPAPAPEEASALPAPVADERPAAEGEHQPLTPEELERLLSAG